MMRKKRVRVVEHGEDLVLLWDKRKPMPSGRWGETPNEIMRPEFRLADQTDGPHTAGLTIVRKDSKGWYIRMGRCQDPYLQEQGEKGTPCNRQKPHVKGAFVEEVLSPEDDSETVYWCPWCHEEEGLNW